MNDVVKKLFVITFAISFLSCDAPRLYMLNNSTSDKLMCEENSFELFFSKALLNTKEAITVKNIGSAKLSITKIALNGKKLKFEISTIGDFMRIEMCNQRFEENDRLHIMFSINNCNYNKTYTIGETVKVYK